MSLKAFHIFFIAVSVLLAVGFGVWEISGFGKSGSAGQLLAGIMSLVAAAALVVYAIRFLRKLKNVRMM